LKIWCAEFWRKRLGARRDGGHCGDE